MRKTKGLALIQALFFMMFIMAMITVAMMMSVQRSANSSGERMAVDAYPVVNSFLMYASDQLGSFDGSSYFIDNPISDNYCIKQLVKDGLIKSDSQCDANSTWSQNLTITIT